MNLTDYERELLAGVEAGEMPIEVYADWLEGEGDPRAAGARWLAENEKRPQKLGIGWWWPSLEKSAGGLPRVVRERMPRHLEPFPNFPEAFAAAAEAAAGFVERGEIDELAECWELLERWPGHAPVLERLRRLCEVSDQDLGRGLSRLRVFVSLPTRLGNGFGWPYVIDRTLGWRGQIPEGFHDRLRGRRESDGICYDSLEEAVRDGIRVLAEVDWDGPSAVIDVLRAERDDR